MNEGGEQWIKHTERGQSYTNAVYTQSSGNVLHDCAVAPPRNPYRIHQSQEIIAKQHDLRALASHLSSRSHGNANRCLHQRRRMIDSVASHGDFSATHHLLSNDLTLLIQQDF